MIEPPTNGSECILTQAGPVNLMSIYAPTLCSTPESQDQFYEELHAAISRIPKTEQLFLLEDFNARVDVDHEAWPICLGHHGLGNMNENGQRLLELCSYHETNTTNTFFKNKSCRKVSWRHPRSGHLHQLDLINTMCDFHNTALNTHNYHMCLPGLGCNPRGFSTLNRKAVYVLTLATLPSQRRINSFLTPTDRHSKTIPRIAEKQNGTLFETPCITLHSQLKKGTENH